MLVLCARFAMPWEKRHTTQRAPVALRSDFQIFSCSMTSAASRGRTLLLLTGCGRRRVQLQEVRGEGSAHSRCGELHETAHLQGNDCLTGVHEVDGNGIGLIVPQHHLELSIAHWPGGLVGQDIRHPDAGEGSVNRRLSCVDLQTAERPDALAWAAVRIENPRVIPAAKAVNVTYMWPMRSSRLFGVPCAAK
jgi:hypothetical protein